MGLGLLVAALLWLVLHIQAAHATFPRQSGGQPDLVIEAIQLSNVNPAPNEPIDITITVRNVGSQVITQGAYVYLYVDPIDTSPTTGTTRYDQTFVPSLAVNGTFVWRQLGIGFGAGAHSLVAWIDPTERIAESDEKNNLRSAAFTVGTGGPSQPDAFEGDNTCETAHAIGVNDAAQSHTIHTADDTDVVRFAAQAGITYTISISNEGAAADSSAELFNGCPFPTGNGNRDYTYVPLMDETVWVRITHRTGGFGANTNYRIQVAAAVTVPTQPDAFESDDTCEIAKAIGVNDPAQTHNFHAIGDTDFVRFAAFAGITYTIGISNNGSSADASAELFNGCPIPTGGGSRDYTYVPLVDETVWVRLIHRTGGYGANTNFGLQVTRPPTTTAIVKKAWTFMLYLAGDTGRIDNGTVFAEMKGAIQRLQSSSANPNVNVVALLDGDDNLDTFRVTFTPRAQYEPLGELAMDDAQTLTDFIVKSKRDFPADHYYLAIADHANGVQGIAWDTTTDPSKKAYLTPNELEEAFRGATHNGLDKIDVVHFDGCSFGLFENVMTVGDYAGYVVASQNIGWSAFAYDSYREIVTATTTPRELAIGVVDKYASALTRSQLPFTASAMDALALPAANNAINIFADKLTAFVTADISRRTTLSNTRAVTQKFDSAAPILQITNDDWYVDVVDYATRIEQSVPDPDVKLAAQAVIASIATSATPLVIHEAHLSGSIDQNDTTCVNTDRVWNLDGANGISLYLPPRAAGTTYTKYVAGETFTKFSQASRWKDFIKQGLSPLVPGEEAPADVLIPLTPCNSQRLNNAKINTYLPIARK